MFCIFETMKERLYKTLNIKHSESSQVFDLLTVQFFIGLANALVNIISFTLFIYNFPIQSFPLVYLATAVLLFFLNLIYEKLEHKYAPLPLLKYIIAIAAILLIALWFGLSYGDKSNFIFLLIVASALIYMVTGYAFWGLVSLLFNVRESRRVFSIVGSGDIPAKLIGYLIAPLMIKLVGVTNVIWLAIVSLIVGYYLFNRFIQKKSWDTIKKKTHGEGHHAEHELHKENFIHFLLKNKLIFAISLLSITSYNVFILVDFTFIAEVKHRYENISDLAFYIAIFFATGRLIALVFKLIFTSRLIEKLGVIYSLFITPAVLLLFCFVFFLTGKQSTNNIFIFGLMAMFTEVLRSTMQEPVFFILFQPLKEKLRLKGHIISKGYTYPPSLIIVGLSLYFMYKTGTEFTILLAIKVVIVNLIIWAAIIFLIQRFYLDTIHASIKKGTFASDDIYIVDDRTTEILLKKIKNGNKIDVIYALNLLEKSDYPELNQLLEQQLKAGKDVAVKKYAMERLDATEKVNIDVLRNILAHENDLELRQKAVAMLCKYDPEYLSEASQNISGQEYLLRKIIIIHLLNQREFGYLLKAGNAINSLLDSAVAGERELAVEIISELKHLQFSSAIETLMKDPEIAVKRVAIMAACKLKMHKLLPSVINLLDKQGDKNIALLGLQLYGDSLFADINQLPPDTALKYQAEFIKIATKIKGEHSTGYLLTKMAESNGLHKDKVLHALWVKEYIPVKLHEKEKFNSLLNMYLHTGLDKINDYHDIPDFNDKELVKRSIYNEVKSDLSLALKACVLLFDRKEINRILDLMEIDKQDKLYNAMEMLELLLPKKISKDLNLLFDFILDPHIKKAGLKPEINLYFSKVIFNTPLLYNPWTRAVCVYSSWKNNEKIILEKLKDEKQPEEHYLVKETKAFVKDALK